MTTGQKLRSARIAKEWTQPQLADAIKVPVETISRWENDAQIPRIDRLTSVAKVLDVPVAYLLDNRAGYQEDALMKEVKAIRSALEKLIEIEQSATNRNKNKEAE